MFSEEIAGYVYAITAMMLIIKKVQETIESSPALLILILMYFSPLFRDVPAIYGVGRYAGIPKGVNDMDYF